MKLYILGNIRIISLYIIAIFKWF